MLSVLLTLLAQPAPTTPTVPTQFMQVAPPSQIPRRSPDKQRAVILIHGLGLHVFNVEKAITPQMRIWQQPDSPLVTRLAKDSDVFSFAYGQTAAVEEIATLLPLAKQVQALKAIGYTQIVLIGHSAGALIARHLVEDHKDLGVTRVIQVCPPNDGSRWASLRTARGPQVPFLLSMTRGNRQKVLEQRAEKRIPDTIEFACVIGSCHLLGDGIVFSRSQWPASLQEQGIPAYLLRTTHLDAMTNARAPELLGKLAVEPMPRWTQEEVEKARKQLLGG